MIRVLVVEDSPTMQELLVSTLEEDQEIKVVGRTCYGKEAIKMASDLDPDLITMDIMLPDITGLETTRQIMAKKPIPILIISAHTNDSELNLVFEALKAGALDVIAKSTNLSKEHNEGWKLELIKKVKALVP